MLFELLVRNKNIYVDILQFVQWNISVQCTKDQCLLV